MIIPIRCFSCGKPVAQDWDAYKERSEKGEKIKAIMDDLGHSRYCCRRMFLTHADVIGDVMKHKRF